MAIFDILKQFGGGVVAKKLTPIQNVMKEEEDPKKYITKMAMDFVNNTKVELENLKKKSGEIMAQKKEQTISSFTPSVKQQAANEARRIEQARLIAKSTAENVWDTSVSKPKYKIDPLSTSTVAGLDNYLGLNSIDSLQFKEGFASTATGGYGYSPGIYTSEDPEGIGQNFCRALGSVVGVAPQFLGATHVVAKLPFLSKALKASPWIVRIAANVIKDAVAFGTIGGLSKPQDETSRISNTLKGMKEGAIFGFAGGLLAPVGKIYKALGMGAVGAGLAKVEGAGDDQVIAQGMLFSILGFMGTKENNAMFKKVNAKIKAEYKVSMVEKLSMDGETGGIKNSIIISKVNSEILNRVDSWMEKEFSDYGSFKESRLVGLKGKESTKIKTDEFGRPIKAYKPEVLGKAKEIMESAKARAAGRFQDADYFNAKELKEFESLNKVIDKKFYGGDIESVRASEYKNKINNAIEKIIETKGEWIEEGQAWEMLRSMPTSKEISKELGRFKRMERSLEGEVELQTAGKTLEGKFIPPSEYIKMLKEKRQIIADYRAQNPSVTLKEAQDFVQKNNTRVGKIEASIQSINKSLRGKTVASKRLFGAKGKEQLYAERRQMVNSVRDYFQLSDADMRKVSNRDPRRMTQPEFDNFIKGLDREAAMYSEMQFFKDSIVSAMRKKELVGVDNLRRSMNLPPPNKMTTADLRKFSNALDEFKMGDIFLTSRALETIGNTVNFSDVKTARGVLEIMEKKIGLTPNELSGIKVKWGDALSSDSSLASKNPLYRWVVELKCEAILGAEARIIEMRKASNELAQKARSSVKGPKGFVDKYIIPRDTNVAKWLEEISLAKKFDIEREMTFEQMDYAIFIRDNLKKMEDYAVAKKFIDKTIDNYMPHIPKGFLEDVSDSGFLQALKNARKRAIKDDQFMTGGATVPFEHYFGFGEKRTGALAPTQNVAAAFMRYVNVFETKKAIDAIVPEIKSVTYAIEKTKQLRANLDGTIYNDKGLTLGKFMDAWLDAKKGKKYPLFIGRSKDLSIINRALGTITSIRDLGASLPAGIISNVGEFMMNYKSLGAKKVAIGEARKFTKEGKAILKKYENFTGESSWELLSDAGATLKDRTLRTLFSLFADSSRRFNRTYLLASLTSTELKSGEISIKRLAQIQLKMGNNRQVKGLESIVSSSHEGDLLLQYKKWALPPLTRFASQYREIQAIIAKAGEGRKLKAVMESGQVGELIRGTIMTGMVGVLTASIIGADEKDNSTAGYIKRKISQELLSQWAAIDPNFWLSTPRRWKFLQDIAKGITMLPSFYSEPGKDYDAGDSKGARLLKRTFTPIAVKSTIDIIKGTSDYLLSPMKKETPESGPSISTKAYLEANQDSLSDEIE